MQDPFCLVVHITGDFTALLMPAVSPVKKAWSLSNSSPWPLLARHSFSLLPLPSRSPPTPSHSPLPSFHPQTMCFFFSSALRTLLFLLCVMVNLLSVFSALSSSISSLVFSFTLPFSFIFITLCPSSSSSFVNKKKTTLFDCVIKLQQQHLSYFFLLFYFCHLWIWQVWRQF